MMVTQRDVTKTSLTTVLYDNSLLEFGFDMLTGGFYYSQYKPNYYIRHHDRQIIRELYGMTLSELMQTMFSAFDKNINLELFISMFKECRKPTVEEKSAMADVGIDLTGRLNRLLLDFEYFYSDYYK